MAELESARGRLALELLVESLIFFFFVSEAVLDLRDKEASAAVSLPSTVGVGLRDELVELRRRALLPRRR